MRIHLHVALTALVSFLSVALAAKDGGRGSSSNEPGTFTYNRTDFLLNDKPFQIFGGQMDPQRIPRQYWAQRLKMARAMGLNTIFSYIFWNNLEPAPGQWNFDDRNDIAYFFELCQQEGLMVVLRPGPYICGEREWGGFPAWLTQIPGMAVRQNNKPFLDASQRYLERLGAELGDLSIFKGGPIIMTQLENEYGSFGKDKVYLQALADVFRANFDTPLYTTDGGGKSYLDGGTLTGVLAQIDGDPKTGFAARDKYVTDPTMLGPLLNGEYYTTWLDIWGSGYVHQQSSGNAQEMKKVTDDIDFMIAGKHSFSLYMFHGGTNFGFENGAIWVNNALQAVTTSYDYGAPLDESGRPNELFYKIRETIAKYVPEGSIPEVPKAEELSKIPEFQLQPVAGLFDAQNHTLTKVAAYPLTMEELNQSYGFVLYRHHVAQDVKGQLIVGDEPRDRVLVYVNGVRVGVIDRIYKTPATVNVALKSGDTLELLVENLGRVDYSQRLKDQRKGIVGNVTVGGGEILREWSMYSMDLEEVPKAVKCAKGEYKTKDNQTPVFYTGSFELPPNAKTDLTGDTFLSIPKGVKGVVWINGIIIGKYWPIGPQQSLYVPGCYLHPSGKQNKVVVLELQPQPSINLVAEGLSVRKWFNQPDPDAPKN